MWSFMESQEPSVFVGTTKEGIERAVKGDYVFLGESTLLDYVTNRQCDLMRIGGLLDSKGYGFITAKGSPLRDRLIVF